MTRDIECYLKNSSLNHSASGPALPLIVLQIYFNYFELSQSSGCKAKEAIKAIEGNHLSLLEAEFHFFACRPKSIRTCSVMHSPENPCSKKYYDQKPVCIICQNNVIM